MSKVPRRWITALNIVLGHPHAYCHIHSAGVDNAVRVFGQDTYVAREPTPSAFGENVHHSKWAMFRTWRGDCYLLVPPVKLQASDISDYARRYGRRGWGELGREIAAAWRVHPGTQMSTHGAIPYLHIRFERAPKYALPSAELLLKPLRFKTRSVVVKPRRSQRSAKKRGPAKQKSKRRTPNRKS